VKDSFGGSPFLSPRTRRAALSEAYRAVLAEVDEERRLDRFLRYTAGAVIAGVRPAALVRLSCPSLKAAGVWRSRGHEVCVALDVESFLLSDASSGPLILVYRSNSLSRIILRGPASRYLATRAYPVRAGVRACLEHLAFNMRSSKTFPHEVGVFLGYPLADVVLFSSGDRRCYDCRGYWRVYQRPERAMRTFALMDESRLLSCDASLRMVVK